MLRADDIYNHICSFRFRRKFTGSFLPAALLYLRSISHRSVISFVILIYGRNCTLGGTGSDATLLLRHFIALNKSSSSPHSIVRLYRKQLQLDTAAAENLLDPMDNRPIPPVIAWLLFNLVAFFCMDVMMTCVRTSVLLRQSVEQ